MLFRFFMVSTVVLVNIMFLAQAQKTEHDPALSDFGSEPAESHLPLQQCQGDCDNDSECASGLRCFQRHQYTSVPGCSGRGVRNYDYCIISDPPLSDFGSEFWDGFNLEQCQGNCNSDNNCAGELKCFQRSGLDPVPGCSGTGRRHIRYCISPTVLRDYGSSPRWQHYPLDLCEGDCDNDGHCAGSLKCFDRTRDEPVPGCTGNGHTGYDYCITDPELKDSLFAPSVSQLRLK